MDRPLTAAQKKKARALCAERDGDRCNDPSCHIAGPKYRQKAGRNLDLDHIDRNPINNPTDGSNWQLLCHPCNCKRSPRGKQRNERFNGIKKLEEYRKSKKEREWIGPDEWMWQRDRMMPAQMKKNMEAEPLFREAALRYADKHIEPTRKKLIDYACEKAKVSQQTGARYLDKMCSESGDLKYDENSNGEMTVRRRTEEERDSAP